MADGHHHWQVGNVHPAFGRDGSRGVRPETSRAAVQRDGAHHGGQPRRGGRLLLRRVGGRRRQRLPDSEPPTR